MKTLFAKSDKCKYYWFYQDYSHDIKDYHNLKEYIEEL